MVMIPTRNDDDRYLGNYYYNITNKLALKAAGGAAGFPLTISTLQLGVGCIYALFLWAAPDARKLPTVTKKDIISMIPVAFCAAAAHSFSVFALSAGAVSFGQIVKAAEPAFAAVLGVTLYKKKISKGKVIPPLPFDSPPLSLFLMISLLLLLSHSHPLTVSSIRI